jgi:mRNA-degrading endonuclease RelE of RelBE toxin-antitoxin system
MKMPKIKFTRRFLKSFARLPKPVQEKVKIQITWLAENPRHPSLQTKPIQGIKGIYEALIDIDYRKTYERESDDTLVLRVVGKQQTSR